MCNAQIVEAKQAEAEKFSQALSAEMGKMTRAELAAEVAKLSGETVTESAVSLWLTAKSEPTRRKVFAIEKAVGCEPGTLSRHLGYLPVDAVPPADVEQALQAAGVPKGLRGPLLAAIREAGAR